MIWSTFKGFVLLDSLKGIINLGTMSNRGLGFGHAKFFLAVFRGILITLGFRIKFSVQRLGGQKYYIFRCFEAFCKLLQFLRKSAPRHPQIEEEKK